MWLAFQMCHKAWDSCHPLTMHQANSSVLGTMQLLRWIYTENAMTNRWSVQCKCCPFESPISECLAPPWKRWQKPWGQMDWMQYHWYSLRALQWSGKVEKSTLANHRLECSCSVYPAWVWMAVQEPNTENSIVTDNNEGGKKDTQ